MASTLICYCINSVMRRLNGGWGLILHKFRSAGSKKGGRPRRQMPAVGPRQNQSLASCQVSHRAPGSSGLLEPVPGRNEGGRTPELHEFDVHQSLVIRPPGWIKRHLHIARRLSACRKASLLPATAQTSRLSISRVAPILAAPSTTSASAAVSPGCGICRSLRRRTAR